MKGFDLLKVAICVMAVVSVTIFNCGCEKENLEKDLGFNANCKYVIYKDVEDYGNRLKEIIPMTREERLNYELANGYESFGTYCEKLYESINPESFKSFDEVAAFVKKNKEYLELIEDENGEYTLEVVNRNNIERYMYGIDKTFIIKDSAYKVLDGNMISCDAKRIFDLTKINEDNYMSYINDSEFTFINPKTNSSDIYYKDLAVNNGTYEIKDTVNDANNNKTRTEIIIELAAPYFEGARTCYAGAKVRPLKKTAGIWFWCSRTIELNTYFYVHSLLNDTWYSNGLYSHHETKGASVLEYSVVLSSPRYVDAAHFGRVYAFGDTPSTPAAIINHW